MIYLGTQNKEFLERQSKDINFKELSNKWNENAIKHRYAYNFTWLDVPIIQVPQDIYIIQELIWKVKPDLIIETGIAHGGSLIMSASMLALLDYCEGYSINDKSGREVVGIDIDIKEHTRRNIINHDILTLINMIEGSSIDKNIIKEVNNIASYHKNIMVLLDSDHSHDHVLSELNSYSNFVSKGSYIVVFDSGLEELPENMLRNNKPWGKGNNPKTAIKKFLKYNKKFEIDKEIENKLMITSVSDGFLRKIK